MNNTGFSNKLPLGLLALGALGLLGGLVLRCENVWQSFLLNSYYFLSLAVAALVFVSIQHLAGATWSTVLRGVTEAMMSYILPGGIALLLIFFGRHALYDWASPEKVHAHHLLEGRSSYLNTPFFFARMAAIIALWYFFASMLRRPPQRQDGEGQIEHSARLKHYSGLFLIVFGLTFSLASIDWLMSLWPEFYSTIFVFYCFSALFVSGVAAITLLVIFLHRSGRLPQLKTEQLHNLGKLLFAFSTFWAYIWISQYLLIYYTNFPEETGFYLRQTANPTWKALFVMNLFLCWVIPFVMLLPKQAKCSEKWLIAAAVIVLIGHWLDLYLIIFSAHGDGPGFLVSIALLLGFGGAFLLTFFNSFAGAARLPWSTNSAI